MISRLKGLKAAFLTISAVLPALVNVVLFLLVVWLFFGILGVHAFNGQFWRCNDEALDKTECVGMYRAPDGTVQPRVWKNDDWHFDNIGWSCLTLFTMATLDNWQMVMYNGMDTTGQEMAPEKNASPWFVLYFLGFIIMGCFLVFNLFV